MTKIQLQGPRRRGAIVKAKLREAFGRVGQPILPYSWVGLQPLASFIRNLSFTKVWPLKQLQSSVTSIGLNAWKIWPHA